MSNLPKIAYFDDDPQNLRMFSQMFMKDFSIEAYQNPVFYENALKENHSAIIIDVLMPVISGFDLFEKIQKHSNYNGCPVFFISGCEEDETKMKSLNHGGVDFIPKLMKRDEMLARLTNKIKNFETNRSIYIMDNLRIDLGNFLAKLNGSHLDCTLIEFKILKKIIQAHPEMISKEDLVSRVWANQVVLNPTVNTHMSNLREKVADWNYEIIYVKNKGYCLKRK
jgi:two-component system, OmpR family, alkaline phosphatase synthesis response regulator PhoP